jgi:ABC-type uncharacterized transport system substrate-binding protein
MSLRVVPAAATLFFMKIKPIWSVIGAASFTLICISAQAADMKFKGKVVLHIDSYDKSYGWSRTIQDSIRHTFNGTGIRLEVFEMDTKRHNKEDEKKAAGLKAKEMIEKLHPDLVIVSDDNAVSYVLTSYFKESPIPFLYCGINWDGSKYGIPSKNTTGMLEVEYIQEVYDNILKFARGANIGYIGGDNETDRKMASFIKDKFLHDKMTKMYFAKNYADFKKQFLQAQGEVDMLYFGNRQAVLEWDDKDAAKFFAENTRIPTGASSLFSSAFVLLTLGKYAQEQGDWVAKRALDVLGGTPPSSIPEAKNKRLHFVINSQLARKLNIEFPKLLLKLADKITTADYDKQFEERYPVEKKK